MALPEAHIRVVQPLAVRFLPKLGRESSHGLFLRFLPKLGRESSHGLFFAASLPSKCPLSGIYYGAKNRLAAKSGRICCRMGQVQT